MRTRRRWANSIMVILLVLAVLWISGVGPTTLAKFSADRYVTRYHKEKNLTRTQVEHIKGLHTYVVHYEDISGNDYSFWMDWDFLPLKVEEDPLEGLAP